MRAAIIDDSLSDRINLRVLLGRQSEVELVGEAADFESARELIESTRPDVVFLDVELGMHNGFHLLSTMVEKPRVVFTTVHLNYAVQAYEVEAADYLVKPVFEHRLQRTLQRLRTLVPARPDVGQAPALETDDLLVFKQGGERRVLPVGRIAVIQGDRDYTKVIMIDGREYLDTRRMLDWQEILPGRLFRSLDRSTIVNITEVSSYRQTKTGGLLNLRNSASPFDVGHQGFKRLEECFDSRPGRS